jgi:hypothetical protein
VGQTLQAMHIKKWQTVIATEAHPVSQWVSEWYDWVSEWESERVREWESEREWVSETQSEWLTDGEAHVHTQVLVSSCQVDYYWTVIVRGTAAIWFRLLCLNKSHDAMHDCGCHPSHQLEFFALGEDCQHTHIYSTRSSIKKHTVT